MGTNTRALYCIPYFEVKYYTLTWVSLQGHISRKWRKLGSRERDAGLENAVLVGHFILLMEKLYELRGQIHDD